MEEQTPTCDLDSCITVAFTAEIVRETDPVGLLDSEEVSVYYPKVEKAI